VAWARRNFLECFRLIFSNLVFCCNAGTLQPADSSTAHTWQQMAGWPPQQHMLQLQQPSELQFGSLQRTSSAPELLKLAQADSAAWHNQHAAGGSVMQQSALLSHHVSKNSSSSSSIHLWC
jgi:hypothetical protein